MKCKKMVLAAALFFAANLCACAATDHGLNSKSPLTLTMWHNFGGEMQKTMDELIDEFNGTVGTEKGIIINVTAISSSSELQNSLDMIINGDPGAAEMPDITTCYPKTAVRLQEKGMLSDLNGSFTAEEQAKYVPAFIEEGRFNDGLYVFPIAKSTEILYVNQTLFDRFAAENEGIDSSCFKTFEGIAEAAARYYEWTDALTPEAEGDGKAFFAADSWLNIAQSSMKQQGGELFESEALSLENDAFKRLFELFFDAAKSGGVAIYDGYSSDLSKTGDIVCSTGSSAGILFYGDTITYSDNTIEQVEYSILPYPTIAGGNKTAIQRGNGICVSKSSETREYAASVFIKWFTAKEQNMRFIASTGYLPVTISAFESGIKQQLEEVGDYRIKKMLGTVLDMYESYDFFTAPVFDSFDGMGKSFEGGLKNALRNESGLSSAGALAAFVDEMKGLK